MAGFRRTWQDGSYVRCSSGMRLAAEKFGDDQERSHRDRGIGDIERRPDVASGAQLQKIGHAAVDHPVEELPAAPPRISARPACASAPPARPVSSHQTSRITTAAAITIRRSGDPLGGRFGEHAEGDAGIPAVHQRSEVRHQLEAKVSGRVALDAVFRGAVGDQHREAEPQPARSREFTQKGPLIRNPQRRFANRRARFR